MSRVIDTRGGGPDLSGLAEALEIVFGAGEEEQMRQAIRQAVAQNPELLAQAARAHERNKERLETPLIDEEGNLVKGPTLIGEEVGPDTTGPGTILGVPPSIIDEISRLFPETVEERTQRLALREGLPEAQVGQAVQEATAGQAEAEVSERTARAQLAEGLPEMEVALQAASTEKDLQTLKEYKEYFETLEGSERQRARLGLINPNFLTDIRQREQMALQERLANLANVRNPAEAAIQMFEVKRDFRDEFNTMTERMRGEDLAPGELDLLIRQFNQLSSDFTTIFPNDPFPIIDPIEKLFGEAAKDFEFRTGIPRELNLQLAAAKIVAGEWTTEDLANAAAFTSEEKNQILTQVQEMQAKSQTGAFENAIDAISKGTLNFLRSATPEPGEPSTMRGQFGP